ncbi:MAG: WxcM-like domain-containing protein [Candidatus Auribacterota bacterium]|nr:WxcM-like domain-containing protein [Candidatus Auribacterota bacterium]
MIKGIKIFEHKRFFDDRGWLTEIWRSDFFKYSPEMGYISITHPGKSRGPHEHCHQTDYFVFMGTSEFTIKLWNEITGEKEEHIAPKDKIIILVVPPGIIHGYKNTGDTDGYVLNLPDKLYAGRDKKEPVDETRHEGNSKYPMD